MRDYIKLMRPHHYVKNILIFLPAFFAGTLFNKGILIRLLLGLLSFSFIASTVYIINDIKDSDKDRMHDIKRNRPIASGKVSVKNAVFLAAILLTGSECILFVMEGTFFNRINAVVWVYLFCNFVYSFGLKNKPIVDVFLLASGFVLRTLFGAALANVVISPWFILTIMMVSLYMGLGKRRNELKKTEQNTTREVLRFYTYDFLDRYMIISLTLGLAFYAYWCAGIVRNSYMTLTLPLVLAIVMKYELNMESDSYGDPVDVLLSDKSLVGLVGIYGVVIVCLMYF